MISKDKKRVYDHEYYRKKSKESKEKLRRRGWLRNRTHFKERLLSCVKSRAKAAGISFNLTVDTLDWPTHCPVLGVELVYSPSSSKKRNPYSVSLDRLVPQLGYIVGNVFVVSFRANRLKDNGSLEEMQAIVRYMEARQRRNQTCLYIALPTP